MSSFIVSKIHIDALLTAGLYDSYSEGSLEWDYMGEWKQLDASNASEIGRMLLRENHSSYDRFLYIHAIDYHFKPMSVATLDPISVINACNCYVYQSMDSPIWEISEAKSFVFALIKRMTSFICYHDDTWEIDDRDFFRK